MQIVKMHAVSYRGRRIHWRTPAWVYRNLMRSDGPWYSIMQNQCVIAHSRVVLMHDVKFIVRQGGRARTVETGVKNVHAFAVGLLSQSETFFDDDELWQLTHRAGYLPKYGSFWVDYKTGHLDAGPTYRFLMSGARSALLSKDGLSVNEPTIAGKPFHPDNWRA